MESKLIFQGKNVIEENGLTSTVYSNDLYEVFILDYYGEPERVNIVSKEFKAPSISVKYGINVPATGSLSLDKMEMHIEQLQIAKSTLEQVNELLKNKN